MINLKDVPDSPGCYIYRNNEGSIIYIGKAKNLRKRVSNYFLDTNHDVKTNALIKNINSAEYITTSNEVEALILENKLIKKHQPKYNINLRDAKTYAYIQLTNEKYPRLLVARNKKEEGTYYGPFTSGQERDYLLKILRKTFKIRTCKKMPRKACLKEHINTCSAPCIKDCSQEYMTNINFVKTVLNGNTKELITTLKNEMIIASGKTEFEKATIIRDKIKALEYLKTQQNIERDKKHDEDVINYTIINDKVYLLLFNISKGVLDNKNEYVFSHNSEFLNEFLIQYYSENPIPFEVIIPEDVDDSIKEFLNKTKGVNVTVTVPKQGEKKQLLDLVAKNIESTFFNETSKLEAVKEKLRLDKIPEVVECFDISHLSGTSTVGSMVQFRNGKPDKSNYRRFKIRTVEGIDDFRAIKEIVERRYSRLKNEGKQYPDLIVIDGGEGQLNYAIKALRELKLRIPIISLAKEFEEIHTPSITLRLDLKDKALQFIQEVRDEAHRFAIKYNRLLHSKKVTE